ncbi:MAG TPA: hypothetical protein PKU80_09000 [Candidatus Limiplasma sp.]|nr:hypothetical protein [Candidatus Limiplasma sp.]HRX08967.1 hypothetical protein [Candidatus Limiplasma sp.]
MREIIRKEWSELPSIWHQLFDENPIATPFQSYEYLTFTGIGKPIRNDWFRTVGLQELNLVLYSDQRPIAIAPMLYKTKDGKATVYFRGHFTAASHLDLVYASLRYDDFAYFMDDIRERLGNVAFFLDRVYGESPTSEYLKKYLSSADIQEHECYSIPVLGTYDDWYCGLSKSRRSNLRLCKNRIASDRVPCSVSFFVGEKIDKATHKKMMSVYADRFLVKNDYFFGLSNPITIKALQIYLLHDKLTQWLNNAENNFHVVVYMNHKVAAFASGLIGKDNRMLGCRLAISTKYKRYSPGAVLISAAIEYLAEQKAAGKLDVDGFDMGQGGHDGMVYKQKYGGEVYYNYTFIE